MKATIKDHAFACKTMLARLKTFQSFHPFNLVILYLGGGISCFFLEGCLAIPFEKPFVCKCLLPYFHSWDSIFREEGCVQRFIYKIGHGWAGLSIEKLETTGFPDNWFSSIHSVVSNSFWPPGLQHAKPPCPSPAPWACSNSCPSSQWCHPTISSSVVLFFSCLQPFPATGSFLRSQFFTSGAKILELQLQHQSFQWIFRVDFL